MTYQEDLTAEEAILLKIDEIDAQYIYSIFRHYMKTLAVKSLKDYHTLANIKIELEVARSNEKSDLISLYEIQANTNKLLDNVQLSKQEGARILNQIIQVEEIINKEEMMDNTITSKVIDLMCEAGKVLGVIAAAATIAMTKGVAGATAAARFPDAVLSRPHIINLLSASALTLTYVSIAAWLPLTPNDGNTRTRSEVLLDIKENIMAMSTCLQKLKTLQDTMIEKLEIYIESANTLVAFHLKFGDRSVHIATKMIEETDTLQNCFKKVIIKARNSARYAVDEEVE